ncbi:hypothetical protein ACAW74_16905 [Fibrella sp. WM1]|uniref:hypothetical protein n=1 Tax=Fibrella musci TaxID=3242485 RepID=UPI00351F8AF4
MKSAEKTSPFIGCWDTKWTTCNGNKAAGARLAMKPDAVTPGQFTGAWGGHTDNDGYEHSGFLIGRLDKTGKTLAGTWYELIYKDHLTCPTLSYSGTFSFTLTSNDSFDGVWTDKDGPSKDCPTKMQWDGNRAIN